VVEINWTREAQVWLRDIYDYIAVHPPHSPGQIHQKLGRSCKILPIDSCACVNQVIAANQVRFWIKKKRKCVLGLLTKIARGVGVLCGIDHAEDNGPSLAG